MEKLVLAGWVAKVERIIENLKTGKDVGAAIQELEWLRGHMEEVWRRETEVQE